MNINIRTEHENVIKKIPEEVASISPTNNNNECVMLSSSHCQPNRFQWIYISEAPTEGERERGQLSIICCVSFWKSMILKMLFFFSTSPSYWHNRTRPCTRHWLKTQWTIAQCVIVCVCMCAFLFVLTLCAWSIVSVKMIIVSLFLVIFSLCLR